MPAKQPPDGVDWACQLALFDEALAAHRVEAGPRVMDDRRGGSNADLEAPPTTPAEPSVVTGWGTYDGTDRAVLKALEGALANARAAADDRPPLVVLASCLSELGAPTTPLPASRVSLHLAPQAPRRRKSSFSHVPHRRDNGRSVGVGEVVDELLDRPTTRSGPVVAPSALRLGAHTSEGADCDGRSPTQRSRLIAVGGDPESDVALADRWRTSRRWFRAPDWLQGR
jgi:hypothetical protein